MTRLLRLLCLDVLFAEHVPLCVMEIDDSAELLLDVVLHLLRLQTSQFAGQPPCALFQPRLLLCHALGLFLRELD